MRDSSRNDLPASNLQDETPPITTVDPMAEPRSNDTTDIVDERSKRTGEGNWDEEIHDEVYF